jgi:HSP20 family molecular chaperone IbpA
MTGIDETIRQVETLYRSLTGGEPPQVDQPYAPIPPEREPAQYVEEQLGQLMSALEQKQPTSAPAVPWMPPMTVWDSAREIVIALEVPGVPREAVEVAVIQNLLTVSGQRPLPEGIGSEHRRRLVERPVGPFRRMIPLPQGVLVDQMSAHLREGVLTIRMPCQAAPTTASPQNIPVK